MSAGRWGGVAVTVSPGQRLRARPESSTMATSSVVIVSSELDIQNGLAGRLSECGLTILFASTVDKTQMIVKNDHVSVIVCPEELPDGSFGDIVSLSKNTVRKVPVIVFSPFADWAEYLRIIGAGAFDYVRYPSAQDEIERVVRNALNCYPKERIIAAASAA